MIPLSGLENKTAFVTGASGGIGRAVSLRFAEAGARLHIADLDMVGLSETELIVRGAGAECFIHELDVGDGDAVKKVTAAALKLSDSIDILVNNAGITRDNLLIRMRNSEWDDVLRVNLTGAFYCTRSFMRVMMKKRSGSIVNVASVTGITGNFGQANYAASKAGLVALTKTAAKEGAPRGIRVNAVAPGFIETAMTGKLADKLREGAIEKIPLGFPGAPGHVAETILFFASDAAGYITGQTLLVDGGLMMR